MNELGEGVIESRSIQRSGCLVTKEDILAVGDPEHFKIELAGYPYVYPTHGARRVEVGSNCRHLASSLTHLGELDLRGVELSCLRFQPQDDAFEGQRIFAHIGPIMLTAQLKGGNEA